MFNITVVILNCNIFITFKFEKYNELFKHLHKDGWYEIRQKGSHIIMQHPTKPNLIPVPFHASKEMKKGTLQAILKLAGIETNKR